MELSNFVSSEIKFGFFVLRKIITIFDLHFPFPCRFCEQFAGEEEIYYMAYLNWITFSVRLIIYSKIL